MLLVLTSEELGASNLGLTFCKDICGYHGFFKYASSMGSGLGRGSIKYGFTGTMARWGVGGWGLEGGWGPGAAAACLLNDAGRNVGGAVGGLLTGSVKVRR
jgi:hypothetical protein